MGGGNLKRAVYSMCIFVMLIGSGEIIARSSLAAKILPKNDRVYRPAFEQMERFDIYICQKSWGARMCVSR